MKRILMVVVVVFITTTVRGQTDSVSVQEFQQEFEILKFKTDSLQSSSAILQSSSEYQEKIKDLNQKSIELSVSGSNDKQALQSIQEQIKTLNPLLDKSIEREKTVNELNGQLARLKQELSEFKKFKQLTEAEEIQSAELIEKTRQVHERLIRKEVDWFIGNLEVYSSLSPNLTLLSKVAESVLIFDEKTSKKLWDGIKKGGLDVLTIAAGAFAVSKFDKGNNTEGYTAVGLGLGFKVLQGQIKDNKTMERITRNIAFSDEIRAYSAVTVPLDSTVAVLYKKIPSSKIERDYWFPSYDNLNQYRKIIDYMKEIQFQNLMIKNKAEYLLELGEADNSLSDEGKKLLNEVISLYQNSTDRWSESEPVYIERHQILLAELQRRDNELRMNNRVLFNDNTRVP